MLAGDNQKWCYRISPPEFCQWVYKLRKGFVRAHVSHARMQIAIYKMQVSCMPSIEVGLERQSKNMYLHHRVWHGLPSLLFRLISIELKLAKFLESLLRETFFHGKNANNFRNLQILFSLCHIIELHQYFIHFIQQNKIIVFRRKYLIRINTVHDCMILGHMTI